MTVIRTSTRTILAAMALAVAGCSQSQPTKQADPVVSVETATAQLGNLAKTVTVYGTVSADAAGQRALVAPIDAIVDRIYAPFGSYVGRGAPVVSLRPSPQTMASIAQATASANQANEALARARRLRADGLMSDADVELAQASATSANATVRSLRGQSTTLRAPIGGSVTQLDYSTGDLVSAGTAVARLTADSDVRGQFGIDPVLARQVRVGDTIRILGSEGSADFSVRVNAVDPVVDPTTRLASVFATIPAQTEIAPGEPLRGEIVVSSDPNAILIPYAALLDDAGQPYVFTVTKGVAKRVDVTVAARDGDNVGIANGLAVGDVVVVKGAAAVSDGVKVTTAKPSSSPTPSATASGG